MISLYNSDRPINKEQYYKNEAHYRHQNIFKWVSLISIEVILLTLFILSLTIFHNILLIGFCVTYFIRLPFSYFKNVEYIHDLIYFGISDKTKKKLVVYHLLTILAINLATVGIALLFQTYTYAIFAIIAIVSLFSMVMLYVLWNITRSNSVELIDVYKNLYL